MMRRSITPREPFRASAAELAAVGIDLRSEDLLLGDASPDDRASVHLGLARLTAENLAFWRQYRLSCGRVTDLLHRLSVKLQRADDRLDFDELARGHGWSRTELERVAELIRRRRYAERSIFRKVKGGIVGLEWLLDERFAGTEDRFVAYASTEPLRAEAAPSPPDRSDEPAAQLHEHAARYSEILLTMGVATERGVPTVTHFGIFRNPLAFLRPESTHRELALELHGFAATALLHALADKRFMVTEPMPVMTEILQRTLGPDEVFEGDSDEQVRRYINRNLPPGVPPIAEGQRYNWAGFTLDARTTVVRLDALAANYSSGTSQR